jgi:hypothetical protein
MSEHPYAERMTALALSFPCLALLHQAGRLSGIRPWRPGILAEQIGPLSHGEQCAIRFVLGIWSGNGAFPGIVPFDFFEAMGTWDEDNREAARAWMAQPFWP